MAQPPPPAYSDVVAALPPEGSGEPSAPPLSPPSEAPAAATPLMTHHHHSESRPTDRGSTSSQSNKIESYVRFSLAHTLRMNLQPDPNRQDPELDVEAQFSRHVVKRQKRVIANKMRLQCVSGWLWCVGVIIVLVYIGVPIGMFITGLSGADKCPHRSGTIVAYLIAGAVILGLTILFRALPSTATIGKNHNWFKTRNSATCTGCICATEVIFYAMLIINIFFLLLGSYWVFSHKPNFECSEDRDDCDNYCNEGVYGGAVVSLVFQYILYVITPVYMCITVSCNHCLRAQELE